MKLLVILGLASGAILGLNGGHAKAREQNSAVEQQLRGVQLSLVSQKRRYSRNDQLRLDVMLRNSREEDIYVFGTLDFGYSASLVLHIWDASGKRSSQELSSMRRPMHLPMIKRRLSNYVQTTS